MSQIILASEHVIRLGFFFGIFAVMAFWEFRMPRRAQSFARTLRWPNNLGIVLLNTVILRIVFPATAVSLALIGEQSGWGLLNNIEFPYWLSVICAVIFLDFAIYLQHVLFHAVPALWRLHRMHHADLDFDVTTGARFHPIEIILSMVIKIGVIVSLGAPALAVLIFEVLLNATAMFNHGNVRIPAKIDNMLRWLLVTPDMHRVHHSVIVEETNSNFGFNLTWWDRLFGTYRSQPREGHENMTIGIEDYREGRDLWLDRMLLQPFRSATKAYAFNRRDH